MTSSIYNKQVIKPFTSSWARQKVSNIYLAITFFFFAFIGSFTLNAAELKILVLVSDRSTASVVAGAHQFLQMNNSASASRVQSNITVRSVSQLNQLNNNQIQQLINQHQALIMAGIFGEPVERLLALNYEPKQTRLVLNTDRRLMVLHQDIQGGRVIDLSKKQLQNLMASVDKNEYLQALKAKQQQWPQFAYWLQARAYWKNRGKENIAHLFTWLGKITAPKLANPKSVKSRNILLSLAPKILPLQPIRFYWQEQLISLAELKKNIAKPLHKPIVFIVDHDTGDQPGQWQLHQQLCQRQWVCVSVLAGWGKPSEEAIESIRSFDSP